MPNCLIACFSPAVHFCHVLHILAFDVPFRFHAIFLISDNLNAIFLVCCMFGATTAVVSAILLELKKSMK